MITIYTDASPAYDYSWSIRASEPIGVLTFNDAPIYEVQIPEDKLDHQCHRYGSGLHISLDKNTFIEWIEDGFARAFKWIS